MAFTAAQQTEMDRMGAGRKAELILEKLEKRTVLELKARVNVLSVGDTITFAPENDYTAQEQAYIEAAQPRTKWMVAIPVLLERAAVLEGGGLSPVVVAEILKGNS
jgi:hypothetical protein|tara:strand:- start:78 stop:395 length:318 start_codon:yes stop_codon:yes gene_type:complete